MRGKITLAAFIFTGMAGHAAAADFWVEPTFMASVSMPLGGGTAETTATKYALAITPRGLDSATERSRVFELSAPIASPTALSLNGVPVFRPVDRNTASAASTDLTTEEKFASVAIVGLAIAGAAGVVIASDD